MKFKNYFQNRTGQKPLTKFVDMETARYVELVKTTGVDHYLKEFTSCSHKNKPPNYSNLNNPSEILEDLIRENGLWQGLEIVNFRFKISGISRILTHQLVRARIGVTFSQHCTGEMDLRHCDILVSRAMKHTQALKSALQAKIAYADLLDKENVPVDEARYILPHNISTYIYMNISLAAFIPLIQKRICTGAQAWEMSSLASELREAVLQSYPMLKPILKTACETGTCWYCNVANKENTADITLPYPPDAAHNTFPWDENTFIYNKTRFETSGQPAPLETQYYEWENIITPSRYQKQFNLYRLGEV